MLPQQPKTIQSLDSNIKLITFLGSTIIFLSLLKSYVFYSTFGIRITNYISFSEAVLLFLNEIAILTLYSFLLLSLFVLIFYLFRLKFKNATPIDVLLPDRKATFLHKILCLGFYVYPLFYLFYAIVMNVRHYGNPTMFFFLLISFIIIEILIIISVIRLWKKLALNKQESARKVFLYTIFISVIFFYTWALERQLFLFHRNKINKEVIAFHDDKRINLTNKDIQFLGATAKHIFCYNISQKRAIVIDASKFERIEFGSYPYLPGFSIFDLLFH